MHMQQQHDAKRFKMLTAWQENSITARVHTESCDMHTCNHTTNDVLNNNTLQVTTHGKACWSTKSWKYVHYSNEGSPTVVRISSQHMAVCKLVKGHVPCCLSCLFSTSVQRDINEGGADIAGERVNSGAGYGVNFLCMLPLCGRGVC